MMFQVENDGPELVTTNYFDSEHADRGYLFLSINAGAFRLLVPPKIEHLLAEMKTGKIVVISRGIWQGRDALEVMFDDGSDNPFMLSMGVEQCDRLPASEDSGRDDLLFSAWVQVPRKAWEARCAYRAVPSLPCLKPWKLKASQ